MAFDSLSEKLQNVFKNLRSKGRLTEADVKAALKEVKMALLEADVNFKVVKQFVKSVQERAIVITILGSSLPGLFGGAMITETLFQIPGIGYTSYQCLVQGDIPFTMFYMTFLAVLTLLGNLLADILYAVADPRVRIN